MSQTCANVRDAVHGYCARGRKSADSGGIPLARNMRYQKILDANLLTRLVSREIRVIAVALQ
jgi:hypothetical protein